MFRLRNACAAVLLLAGAAPMALAQDAADFAQIGRAATPGEVAAWDIDVRPDFKGLPAGSGSVDQGMEIWESTCATCHGIFGEANNFFTPLVGGTTADDVETGHVANLKRQDYPGTTTMMRVATVSTLWDYIHRAMPWDHPKSLSDDDVYAVTAYLLNMAEVVPDDLVLSNENIAEVQESMPNRKGMTTQHAMWPGDEFGTADVKPDTHAEACMKDCGATPEITSELPDSARDMWGNLRLQSRTVGAQLGADTTQPEGKLGDAAGPVEVVGPKGSADAGSPGAQAMALLQDNGCMACHGIDKKIIGPAFTDVAKKYSGQTEHLVASIKSGSSGVWGDAAMPPQNLPDEDLNTIAEWLASGARQ